MLLSTTTIEEYNQINTHSLPLAYLDIHPP
jgi:hypothetical protein